MNILTSQILKSISKFYNQNKLLFQKHSLSSKKPFKTSKYDICVIATILVAYQFSGYKNFKLFYINNQSKLKRALNRIPSYSWFLRLQKSCLFLMLAYLESQKGQKTGIYFIDSTPIKVCNNRRIHNHKVLEGIASRGHHSMGWFYGFKLHLVINHDGEIMDVYLSKANKDDRIGLEKMTNGLSGKIFGDKGYISEKHKETLNKQRLKLITKVRKNMKPQKLTKIEKTLLYRRGIVETVIEQLKRTFTIENQRIRSFYGLCALIASAIIAYNLKPVKPKLALVLN
jgi:hypothetical protein